MYYICSLVPKLPDLFNAREKKIGEPGDEATIYVGLAPISAADVR